jgi:hypothetical protein
MNLDIKDKLDIQSGVFYGTLFLDCPEEIANTIRDNLSSLFGHVELARVSGEAFTFAVSA